MIRDQHSAASDKAGVAESSAQESAGRLHVLNRADSANAICPHFLLAGLEIPYWIASVNAYDRGMTVSTRAQHGCGTPP